MELAYVFWGSGCTCTQSYGQLNFLDVHKNPPFYLIWLFSVIKQHGPHNWSWAGPRGLIFGEVVVVSGGVSIRLPGL